MANVAKMAVMLTANTRGFRKNMKRSTSALKRFTNSAKRMSATLGRAVRRGLTVFAVGITVASVAMVALIRSSAKSIDLLAKWSDRLGITTEALSGFQFAAELGGVALTATNKAIQLMTKNLAEAAIGMGEAKDVLKAVGINAKKLVQLPLQQQLLKISDAMSRLKSSSEKVLFAFRLFGGKGVGLIPVLSLGSKALLEMRKEAELLGFTVSRFDAAKVEQMNDAITKLKAAFTGIGNVLVVQVAPLITGAINLFVEWAKAGGGVQKKVVGALNAIIAKGAKVVDFFRGIKASWLELRSFFLNAQALLFTGIAKAGEAIEIAINAIIRGIVKGFKFALLGITLGINVVSGLINKLNLPFVGKLGTLSIPDFITNFKAPQLEVGNEFLDALIDITKSDALSLGTAAANLRANKASTNVSEFFKKLRDAADKDASATLRRLQEPGNAMLDFSEKAKKATKAVEEVKESLKGIGQFRQVSGLGTISLTGVGFNEALRRRESSIRSRATSGAVGKDPQLDRISMSLFQIEKNTRLNLATVG